MAKTRSARRRGQGPQAAHVHAGESEAARLDGAEHRSRIERVMAGGLQPRPELASSPD